MITIKIKAPKIFGAKTKNLEAAMKNAVELVRQKWSGYVSGHSIPGAGFRVRSATYLKSIMVKRRSKFSYEISVGGKIPLIIEKGFDSFDMKCFVGGKFKIFTSKGWKGIRNIKIGDLVLTHKGKFKRVLKVYKNGSIGNKKFIRIYLYKRGYGRNPKNNFLDVTKNHPFLTKGGWKKADELTLNDKLLYLFHECETCGDSCSIDKMFCSHSCRATYMNEKLADEGRLPAQSKKNRIRFGKLVARENHKRFLQRTHVTQKLKKYWKKQTEKGNHPFQVYHRDHGEELQKAVAIGLGKKHMNTGPENKFLKILKDEGYNVMFACDFNKNKHKTNKNIWLRQYKVTLKNKYKLQCGTTKIRQWRFLDFYNPYYKICVEINGERWHTKEGDNKRRNEIESLGIRYISFWSKEVYHNRENVIDELNRILNNHDGKYIFRYLPILKIEKLRKHFGQGYRQKWNVEVNGDNSYVAGGVVCHNSGLLNGPHASVSSDGNRFNMIPISGRGKTTFRRVSSKSKPDSWIHPGVEARPVFSFLVANTSKTVEDILVRGITRDLKEVISNV